MSSLFSSSLTGLDGNLEVVQSQLDCLRAGLDVNDDQLSHSLTDARQHAAMLRDLIRAERPSANWNDRRTLVHLVHELDIVAQARRNQQRRTKLLDLANELEAGRTKHRFDARNTALNVLRLEAIKELRTEAACSEQEKELPGPKASQWLHWVCSLEEEKDPSVLMTLRSDFAAVERFTSEIEESYWVSGQRVQESPRQLSEPSVRPEEEPAAESLASPSFKPVAPVGTNQDKLPQNVSAHFNTAMESGDYGEALALCYEPPSSDDPSVPETLWPPEAATHWQPPTAAVASDPSDMRSVASAPVKYCDNCGSTYRSESHVCAIDDSGLRVASEAIPGTTTRDNDLIVDKMGEEGDVRVPAVGATYFSSPLHLGGVPSPEPAVLRRAEPPSVDPPEKPAIEFEELKETLRERAGDLFWSFCQAVPRQRQVVAATIIVLGLIFVFYVTAGSKTDRTVAAASAKVTADAKLAAEAKVAADAKVDSVVQSPNIQKDVEQRLKVLRDSSIQVTVEDGVVTLVGQSSSKEDLVKAETLASQASGVKAVRTKIKITGRNPS